jgi:hypothetical protein
MPAAAELDKLARYKATINKELEQDLARLGYKPRRQKKSPGVDRTGVLPN